jgi:Na+/melibiose symporter-like transporter
MDKIAYGTGNLATGAAMQVLGTYIVFYATAVLGLPGSAIGAIMGLSILWDAVTDPVMGYVSDKTRHRGLGRRHPYMIIGALGIAIVNSLVWTIDTALGLPARLVLITVYIFLFKTFMTIYVTPYTALGAELSVDYNERTAIQGIKSVFFVLGLAFVSVAGLYWFFKPTVDFPAGQLNPAAYVAMGLATSIAVLVAALASFMPTLKYLPRIKARSQAFAHIRPASFKDSMARALGNRPFRMVVLAYMFSNLASALLANLGLHVFTYTFGLGSGQIATVVGIQFLFAILSQPFWAAESRRLGKRAALVTGFGLSILGSVYFVVLVLLHQLLNANVYVFIPFAVTVGSGIGALFTLPLSMVADTVDLDEADGGARIEGVYFGALTLVYKVSQAAVLLVIGILLDIAGFNPALASQRPGTVLTLGLFLGIGAMVSFSLAIVQLRGYGLDEAAVAACRQRIIAWQLAARSNPDHRL